MSEWGCTCRRVLVGCHSQPPARLSAGYRGRRSRARSFTSLNYVDTLMKWLLQLYLYEFRFHHFIVFHKLWSFIKDYYRGFPVVITMLDIDESETNTTHRMSEFVCICSTLFSMTRYTILLRYSFKAMFDYKSTLFVFL